MKRLLLIGLGSLAGLTTGSAGAQEQGTATLYGSGHFKGPSMALTGPREHIDPPFITRSVRIPEGSSWEVCTGNTYTGCRQLDRSATAMILDVRSARPVMAAVVSGAAGPARSGSVVVAGSAGAPELPDRSLRGLVSEFFVAPRQNGGRIAVQPGTGEAMRRAASEFCRAAGWQTSYYARLQSAGRAFYLADVLCTDNSR